MKRLIGNIALLFSVAWTMLSIKKGEAYKITRDNGVEYIGMNKLAEIAMPLIEEKKFRACPCIWKGSYLATAREGNDTVSAYIFWPLRNKEQEDSK